MNKSNQPEVDWLIFSLSATLLALVVLPVVLFPEASQSSINAIFKVLKGDTDLAQVQIVSGD